MSTNSWKLLASETRVWLAGFTRDWLSAWDRFWFTPRSPETLAFIRICCGAMMTYVHCVWLSRLSDFMGASAWIDLTTIRELHSRDWAWSWLFYTDHLGWLILHQVIAIAACLSMTLGLITRLAVPLAWWMTLMVCHRMTGALFGLDQVIMMLSMYLIGSRCGSVWSIDARLSRGLAEVSEGGKGRRTHHAHSLGQRLRQWLWPLARPSIGNNIMTRLLQIHLCVIYLFGGLSKMRGEMWWDGSAIWFSIVNYEYQSIDLTWLGHFPIAIGLMTAGTIFWETFYCALIWPRLTRPVTLAMAFLVHGGICVALGMWTFGTMMLVANLIFISPENIRRSVSHFITRKATVS